jgi:hypothetical protein
MTNKTINLYCDESCHLENEEQDEKTIGQNSLGTKSAESE